MIRVKYAEAAWQRALRKGQIGSKEIGRLAQGAEHLTAPSIRKNLSSFASDLSGPALDRHRELQKKLFAPVAKHYGVTPHNLKGMGPATSVAGVFVDPHAGTQLREIAEGSLPRKILAQGSMASGKPIPESILSRVQQPHDPSTTMSILRHELGERSMLNAAQNSTYQPNMFASHFGPLADIAERAGQRDPATVATMDRIRQAFGKDDPKARALLRQYGNVGSHTIPAGGRAHRHLEGAIEKMPVHEATMQRAMTGAPPTGDGRKWSERFKTVADYASTLPLPGNMREGAAQASKHLEEVLARPFRHQSYSNDASKKYLASLSAPVAPRTPTG